MPVKTISELAEAFKQDKIEKRRKKKEAKVQLLSKYATEEQVRETAESLLNAAIKALLSKAPPLDVEYRRWEHFGGVAFRLLRGGPDCGCNSCSAVVPRLMVKPKVEPPINHEELPVLIVKPDGRVINLTPKKKVADSPAVVELTKKKRERKK